MLANRVLITAGTPGHMYLEERQAKCLKEEEKGKAHSTGKQDLLWCYSPKAASRVLCGLHSGGMNVERRVSYILYELWFQKPGDVFLLYAT